MVPSHYVNRTVSNSSSLANGFDANKMLGMLLSMVKTQQQQNAVLLAGVATAMDRTEAHRSNF